MEEFIDVLREKNLLIEDNTYEIIKKHDVKYISYNSKDVAGDTLFVCKGKGFRTQHLIDAVNKGAFCYVAEKKREVDTPCIIVKNIRKALTEIGNLYHNQIWNGNLDMVGITGTKGKTTTAIFLKAIIDDYCRENNLADTGLITGVYTYDGKEKKKATLTTPETFELHQLLANCVYNDCKYLVMETSSQALKYGRSAGINYKVGLFLNLGEDHISDSEHEDMEDYFGSKLKIFKQSDIACVNLDIEEPYCDRILSEAQKYCSKIVTFSKEKKADVFGYDVVEDLERLKLKVNCYDEVYDLDVNIGGSYNVENVLSAVATATALDIPFHNIQNGLKTVKVPGRMEIYTLPNKDVKVIVDYAHNEMSYRALFESVKTTCPDKKKMFLFGCVGGRAFNRRKEGGIVANEEADKVVLTEYDYGEEDIMDICNEIKSYISPEKDVVIIPDREEAVRHCLDIAEDGWVVILAGYSSGDKLVRGKKHYKVPCDVDTVINYIKTVK